MKLIDFEKQIFLECQEKEGFEKILKEEVLLELEKESSIFKREEKNEKSDNNIENIITDYLEEISVLKQLTEEENKIIFEIKNKEEKTEKIIEGNLLKIADIALDYLVTGVDYLDLIQEGNIGLLEGLNNYKRENRNISILVYIELWIRRSMLLFIKNEFDNEKQIYKHFFLEKINEIETIFEDENDKELIENKEKEAKEKDKKLLKEKIEWLEQLDYNNISKKMTEIEEKILKKYYGLNSQKRESIFEIENDLKLERGMGEIIFKEALSKLSSTGGKIIKL